MLNQWTKYIFRCFYTFLFVFAISFAKADSLFVFYNTQNIIQLSRLYCYEDSSGKLSVNDVCKKNAFTLNPQTVTNLGISNSAFWIKLNITNQSTQENLVLGASNPILDEVDLYEVSENGNIRLGKLGDKFPYMYRIYNHQNFLFDIRIPVNETRIYLLRVKSWEQILLPLFIGTPKFVMESNLTHDLIFGIFFGIMLALVLYNLFIYFSVRDSSYLFYVTYIFLITIVQACLNGYTLRFLFPENPEFANVSLILFNSLAGLASIRFIQLFMDTKKYVPILNKGYLIIGAIYIGGIVSLILDAKQIGYKLMDLGGFLISFYTLFITIKIAIKGSKPAKLFLLAWSVFLIGVILFVLKNTGVLPSNSYTNHLLTFGVATEGILLSIALATRINDYKRDKELSQIEANKLLIENERIINEQNIILENKVKERTIELQNTLTNLKDTQSQLVNVEKMASLGQLTAGIAHEINNPINFVSANIKPLKMDIDDVLTLVNKYETLIPSEINVKQFKEIEDYRKEIDIDYIKEEMASLLVGIEDGAKRTTEIVLGLKNFSRLDESDVKEVNINDGIKSTLVLLRNTFPENLEVVVNLEKIPHIECLPGKLNQVFMNLLSNALFAISKNKSKEKHKLVIKSYELNNQIFVSIEDTGIGMSEEVKSKIFEPFFTTKDVGEGTGLGMSIVFRILESHNAKLEIESEVGVGTKMLLILNKQINLSN